MGIKHPFVSAKSDGTDATKVRPTGWNADHVIDGDVDFNGFSATNLNQALVVNDPYNATSWNGDLSVPTKDAIRDKIEALVLSGGGVTDFLALTDTPSSYVNPSGGPGPFLTVNAAENAVDFKYSTEGHLDIRDFGTVVDGGDIGPALQATFDFVEASGETSRIRVPMVGDGVYTCSTITFPNNVGIILELDCAQITTSNLWHLEIGQSIVGMKNSRFTLPHPYRPLPRPTIQRNTSQAIIRMGFHNTLLENLHISNSGSGVGVHAEMSDLMTLKNCEVAGSPALYFDTNFWMQLENVTLLTVAGQYNAIFATDFPATTNAFGLLRAKHIFCLAGEGILFRGFAGAPTNNSVIEDIHSESQNAGAPLITFDSTTQSVGQIEIIRAEQSDAGGATYLLKNIGNATKNIIVRGPNRETLLDPTSDPIDGLLIDNSFGFQNNEFMAPSIISVYDGFNKPINNWRIDTIGMLDAKLAASPVGFPWTIGTPLAIEQDPANWVNLGGATITTGITGPDGSTMAGRVTGGSGAHCFSANVTLAVGDYVIQGLWIRTVSGARIVTPACGLNDLGAPGNDGLAKPTGLTLYDNITDNGWQWRCITNRINAAPGGPVALRYDLSTNGAGADYFNPCAIHIPAAAAVDPIWLHHYARAVKGGWSSTNVTGEVGVLDHQIIKAGSSTGAGGVKAFKLQTPRAAAKTIAAGVITITGSYHVVDTEAAAATDDLDTISGGSDGQRLVLRASNAARDVVIKDGTGNIQCAGDFTLNNTQDTIELIFDSALAAWLELGRSDNGA